VKRLLLALCLLLPAAAASAQTVRVVGYAADEADVVTAFDKDWNPVDGLRVRDLPTPPYDALAVDKVTEEVLIQVGDREIWVSPNLITREDRATTSSECVVLGKLEAQRKSSMGAFSGCSGEEAKQ